MGLSPSLFAFMRFLLSLLLFYLILFSASYSFVQPVCHDDESFALMKFKESFTINRSASGDPSAYPKVSLWEPESGDCCRWRGVKCNEDTGHVISIDLSSSCLYGSINSSSSLFQLVHLQSLNLADNHFNHSHIPTAFRQLSRLTNLNLSYSVFSGQITSEIFELSNLVSLDLSGGNSLKLQKPGLKSLAQKLTNLIELNLSEVDISSTVPNILANLSSLTSLFLSECGLHGEFPTGIFHLHNLRSLDAGLNKDLTGRIPDLNRSSPLELLELSYTSFSGELPGSIGNLKSLYHFGARECNFSGPIPSSLGNLTQLFSLDLAHNGLHGEFPTGIFHLQSLRSLDAGFNKDLTGRIPDLNRSSPLELLELSYTSFSGELPGSIGNLKSLYHFGARECNFSGPIPSSLGNLTQLSSLDLAHNGLHGEFPIGIFHLHNLRFLDAGFNKDLTGRIPDLNRSSPLELLVLCKTSFSGELPGSIGNLKSLYCFDGTECNFSGPIPSSLGNLTQLSSLDLAHNGLHGSIPLSISRLVNLRVLRLDSNKLRGSLPIPPPSINWYSVSNNTLTGEIPQLICNLSSAFSLDLSSNYLSGLLPKCLGNMSEYLSILNLHGNSFNGTIPDTFSEGNKLKMIDFSQNQLQGRLPRSLANCTMLEVLNLGHNQVNDTFPFWLGILPELRVLILRSNGIYGAMGNPNSSFDFPNISIIDLSNNEITGKLPSQYFQTWKAKRIVDVKGLMYMQANESFTVAGNVIHAYFPYTMTFTYKGAEREYKKILDIFIAIDLSSNKFGGEIPEVVGHLKGLQLLNLSNNFLTGPIPSSLVNLSGLEVLDFAQNKLSGVIPTQLVQLTFLAFFNVSHNHLKGPIPQGNQFNTFPNSSFSDNPELCGNPLSKKCGNSEHSPPLPSTFEQNQKSSSSFEFTWKVVVMGYGCGFIVGLLVGQIVIKHDWVMRTFAIGQATRRMVNLRGKRN